MCTFLMVTLVFVSALVFAQRPYYRQHLGFGSPPIAIRSGLMAFACIPILFALAGKANVITLFTGISHERLNVIHRCVAWISFALSLFHALPYFVASYRDYGFGGYARVKYEFYMSKGPAYEYSGVPALAILFGLCVLSLPQIRNQFYESFFAVHICLAVTYIGLCFWHSGNVNDSWAYLYATLAIWLASWLARACWFTRPLNIKSQWLSGAPATLTLLHDNVTRIETWPPSDFVWTPGQHAFLRFPSFAPMENHPFTIGYLRCSIDDKGRELLREWIPSASACFHRSATTTTVWLDGPYGGVKRPLESVYDTLLLVACGSGITACLPWMLHAVARAKADRDTVVIKRVVLVWVIRHATALSWIQEELSTLHGSGELGVEIICRFHLTGSSTTHNIEKQIRAGSSQGANSDVMARSESGQDNVYSESVYAMGLAELGTCITGRPAMKELLNNYVGIGEKVMVIGCGPETFKIDLANAVAGAQKRVLTGQCREIALHLETFGW
ncbi:hypothetical protein LIPSTDRAFT_64448 [Lipomyces starkeyi NRRL Y-11557]|uniref:ferric-chelate reductase (NADPH) n=1 Tax=Lipomyces starkeyi NRRL Y-11557 TaxID=675824 RepID=A0A1E3Q3L0_LIPST|nr:hypothetical protein LIPSTDRAFT_64448 [Lipomyces starkeyi NRRL Y-11557]